MVYMISKVLLFFSYHMPHVITVILTFYKGVDDSLLTNSLILILRGDGFSSQLLFQKHCFDMWAVVNLQIVVL